MSVEGGILTALAASPKSAQRKKARETPAEVPVPDERGLEDGETGA